jgi:hypothetical protein
MTRISVRLCKSAARPNAGTDPKPIAGRHNSKRVDMMELSDVLLIVVSELLKSSRVGGN